MTDQRAVSDPGTAPDEAAGLPFGPRARHLLTLEFGDRQDFDERNRKGGASAYCKTRHPGAIGQRWSRERGLTAMRE